MLPEAETPVQAVGTCPVCNGTKRQPYTGLARYADQLAGYSKLDNTIPCGNCGGQYMYGSPTGLVKHNHQGIPCTHEYKVQATSPSGTYTTYRCIHCDDFRDIDSGD